MSVLGIPIPNVVIIASETDICVSYINDTQIPVTKYEVQSEQK